MPHGHPPEALLLVSSHCPHCPTMLKLLGDMVKEGRLARLEVINIEILPETAGELGVRSVPWLRIGGFELAGVRGRDELLSWATKAGSEAGMADYFHALLKEGDLPRVLAVVHAEPRQLEALLPIVANPEASINVRIGAGAVFEDLTGTPAIRALIERLGALTEHQDARVRADACHYLGLTRDRAAATWLRARLGDLDSDVREIADESLHLISAADEADA